MDTMTENIEISKLQQRLEEQLDIIDYLREDIDIKNDVIKNLLQQVDDFKIIAAEMGQIMEGQSKQIKELIEQRNNTIRYLKKYNTTFVDVEEFMNELKVGKDGEENKKNGETKESEEPNDRDTQPNS